jgi:radical SAM superfamily enzyme YgiQ (UPF0313 family)
MGEAEESLAELVRCLDLGQEPKDVAGVWYRHNGSIIQNATRQPAHDLDQFPMPDIGTEDHFVYRRGSFRPLDREELVKRWGHHYMTINARGCPMRCTYCCNSQLARRFDWTFVRRKSVPAIIAELKEVKRLYPELRGIKFSDDAFGDLPLEYIEEFAGAYKQEIGLPLGIPGFSPSNLTEEKLAPLVDAGLVYVRIGIQSGSPDIRKLYGRRDTNEQIVNAVNAVQTFGKKIERFKLDMITDNPWEDDEDVIASVKLLLELPKPYVLALFSLTLFPGTPLYTKARREGIVSDENPIYRRHFYNLGKEPPLNRLLDLFRRKVVLKDRILEMLEVYQDAEQFEKLFAEYMKALPKSYLGRILPRRKKEVMW